MTYTDTHVDAIAGLARTAVEPIPLERDTTYAIPDVEGKVYIERVDPEPLTSDRINATRLLEDLDSFLGFLERHAGPGTEVYVSPETNRIMAIIDGARAHSDDGPPESRFGLGRHKAVFDLMTTDAWRAWHDISGDFLPQNEFAEFIEDHALDIIAPTSAAVLEIAQSIQATTDVEFSSSQRLDSGETRIGYSETVKAKAGQRGELVIPRELTVALQPFKGVTELKDRTVRVPVTARFRYRLRDGSLRLGVKLLNTDRALEAIWGEIVDELRAEVAPDVPVFIGRP